MSNGRVPSQQRRKRGHDPALNDAPGSSRSQRVKFTMVEIREFERVVGDNPSCSSGVPVSIGWGHGKTFKMKLEDFESARPPRRAQMDLVLTRGERHRLLVEWGASGQDVIEAIRMIIRVKNQRRQTVNNLGSYDRIEWAFEKFTRGIRSAICSGQSNARQLQDQSERAAAANKGYIQRAQSHSTSIASSETVQQESAVKIPDKFASAGSNGVEAGGHSENLRNESPLFREVKLMNQEQIGNSSEENDEPSRKPLSPEFPPEEFPTGENNNTVQVNIRDLHEVISKHESGNRGAETYDDVDDMSNPQSHDHKGRKFPIPKQQSMTEC